MTQQLVLEPLGIITEPNKLGLIPAGALSSMTDCVERSPGVIENMRAWQSVAVVGGYASTTMMFLIVPPGPQVLVLTNNTATSSWIYQWFDLDTGNQTFWNTLGLFGLSTYNQSIPLADQPHLTYAIIGNQLHVNTYSTVLVWDTYDPQTSTDARPRQSGIQAPGLTMWTQAFPGTAIPAGKWVAYTATVERRIGDKLAISAPSAATYAHNLSTTAEANQTVRVLLSTAGAYDGFREGDVVKVYRTRAKPHGFAGTPYVAYQAGEEVGAEYLRALTHTITAADISALSVDLVDSTPEPNLGEALYTNQSRSSAAAAAEPAPSLEAIVPYKGHLFGFGPTDVPRVQLRPRGFFGAVSSTASQLPDQVFLSGLGEAVITGCTYANGGTTVTVSPTSQLAKVARGMQVSGTGISAIVQSVGGSSFTIAPAATAAGAGVSLTVYDLIELGAAGAAANNFITDWPVFNGSTSDDPGYKAAALVLKLPAQTMASEFRAQPTDGFALSARTNTDARHPLTVRASRGQNFDPEVPNLLDAAREYEPLYQSNGLVWSELNEPEAWPLTNKDYFSHGEFCGAAATKDAIIAFYTDSIWRISGTGGSAGKGYDWRYDPIATGITLQGSQLLTSHGDKVYALTSEGFIVIEESSVIRNISQGRVHDQLSTPPWSDGPYSIATAGFMFADEEHNEIVFREPGAAAGRMWVYNIDTDRLSQTISHAEPTHGGYSRYLRAPLVIGRDGATWTIKAQNGAYGSFSFTYQRVYGENPFAQRQWQTLNVSAETAGATVQPTFNATAGSTRTLDADGRAGFEVPRNAPAVGNTLQVTINVTTTNHTKLHGFALDYRDHTDRRKNR